MTGSTTSGMDHEPLGASAGTPVPPSSQARWEIQVGLDQTPSSPTSSNGTTAAAAAARKPMRRMDAAGATPGMTLWARVRARLRRPAYGATAALFIFALATNAATGNLLWLWYTTVGALVFGTLVVLQVQSGVEVPERLVALVGVAAALHYGGGSLSGVHWVGGENGLYLMFPWWDNLVHLLGSAAVAGLALALWPASLVRHRGLRVFFALAVSALVGVAVELFEFLHFVWAGTVDQGYYTNSMPDLYYNLLGAVLALLVAWPMLTASPPRTST